MIVSTRQTVTFSKVQHDWLRMEARRLGITVSDLVRRLIDEARAKRR
jgi:macrodomain Ter protein organizer (MatP/YcbG family)